jgi:hypothetical protein
LAYNLRNASDHRSDVLRVTYGARIGMAPRVDASISDEVLDDALSETKWQARVRKELRTHPRPIQVANLLSVLRACVQRIYFQTLLAQRTDIESAIETLQALAEDVECAGELALVSPGPPDPTISQAGLTLTIERLELEGAAVVAAALPEGERLIWPHFAVQVSSEWLEKLATNALLGALADDRTVHSAFLSVVESVGTFVGVTAATAYAARSAVTRAIVRSEMQVEDHRTGPAHSLP